MKICKRCFREFDEEESQDISPAGSLAEIFLRDIDIEDLCPECREELGLIAGIMPGMINFLG
mgnify:CR=1 FL=1